MKYNYIFKQDINSVELHSKPKSKDIYRTHWAFPEIPVSLKGKDCQFKTVACNEIIIDIDGDNDSGNYHLEDGLKVAKDIMQYLSDLFPELNVNLYYSGLKGFHLAIPLSKYYEFNTHNVKGKSACVVTAYYNLLDVLRSNITLPDTINLDNGLTQSQRLIQLINKKKNDDNSERGFKICIANSKTTKLPSIPDIKKASLTNMNMVKPLKNKYKNCRGFIEFLTDKLGELKTDKPVTVKRPNNSDNLGGLQTGLNPILNELDKKYKKNGHENIRTPIIYTVKAYIPDLDDALPFIEFLSKDERHGAKNNNTCQSLINAFNNGEANSWVLYHKLEIKSDDDFDKRKSDDKERFKENQRLRKIFFDFRDWLEDYKKKLEHKKTLKQGEEFALEVQENKNDLVGWYEQNLPEYLGKQNHKNLLFGNMCCLAVNMGTLLSKYNVEGDSEGGKDFYCNMLENMNPNFLYIGNITAKAFLRTAVNKGERAFDRLVIYLGDKTLKTQSKNDEDEYLEIEGTIAELVTRGEDGIERTVSAQKGEGTETFRLVASGLMHINTGTYINQSPHGAGRQQETRTISIAIAPETKEQVKHIRLRDDDVAEKEHKQQLEFIAKHKAYQTYVAENPVKVILTREIKKEILEYVKYSDRGFKRINAIFKAYCNFIRVEKPTIKEWIRFKQVLPINTDLNPIESEFYETIIKGTMAACNKDEEISDDHIFKDLLSRRCSNKKEAVFFTVTGLRTYRRNWFRSNANLRDISDRIPEILKNLETKGYIKRVEMTDERGENIYYWGYIEGDEDLE